MYEIALPRPPFLLEHFCEGSSRSGCKQKEREPQKALHSLRPNARKKLGPAIHEKAFECGLLQIRVLQEDEGLEKDPSARATGNYGDGSLLLAKLKYENSNHSIFS